LLIDWKHRKMKIFIKKTKIEKVELEKLEDSYKTRIGSLETQLENRTTRYEAACYWIWNETKRSRIWWTALKTCVRGKTSYKN